MSIKIYNKELIDKVLKAYYYTGETTYNFALKNLHPLIQRLDIQRNLQKTSFYNRLRSDLIKGCIMPPITVAFITDLKKINDAKVYINKEISNAFILDGIQRLNALNQAYSELNIMSLEF